MEYRPYYLAREWVRAGHAVHIVAASFSHVRSRQPQVSAKPLIETIDGIVYHWLPAPAYRSNGVARVRNIWTFLRRLWQATPALLEALRPDVVVASSTYPMDIWVARRIAMRVGARLVYEVHDLWPASPMALAGMSRWHPFIMLCQKAEDDACRHADWVVSMLPNVAEHLQAHGLDVQRLHIVPNGVALDDWECETAPLPSELAAHLEAVRAAGRTVVGYAGSHGQPNALDVLLDAAALLNGQPFSFVLVGDGMEKARLAARVRREGLAHVALFEPIAKVQIPSFLRHLDIAYIGWLRMPLYRFGIAPNKLMDYMMAGCAVLHSVEAGNDPVAEAGCGLTVAPESAAAVAEGLRSLADRTPAERRAMGERGRAYVMARHTYPVLARRFIDAIEGRSGGPGP